MSKSFNQLHVPVLLESCLNWIRPAIAVDGSVVVDATLGMGGHSEALLEEFPTIRVIGIDRDPVAIAIASQRLERFAERFTPVLATYDQMKVNLDRLGVGSVAAVLMDLGVSSLQLDEADRGFAYAKDAPLDMRMNQESGETASDIVNSYSEGELTRIFRDYGEERFASRVARAIVQARSTRPILTSTQLNSIVDSAIPHVPGKQTGHPAKRVYQALRVAVNREFEILESALPQAIELLQAGGRLVVMSYHSIEDSIVKAAMREAATSKTPSELPIELPGTEPILKILTRGVERAAGQELDVNPRAASARLRVAEKLERR
jgi:16S rRNA (cytosine1402-N4)-methyltransferase